MNENKGVKAQSLPYFTLTEIDICFMINVFNYQYGH